MEEKKYFVDARELVDKVAEILDDFRVGGSGVFVGILEERFKIFEKDLHCKQGQIRILFAFKNF